MNATANNPAQQGERSHKMPMEEINPDGNRVVPMLEKLQQQQEANNIQQTENKEEILR